MRSGPVVRRRAYAYALLRARFSGRTGRSAGPHLGGASAHRFVRHVAAPAHDGKDNAARVRARPRWPGLIRTKDPSMIVMDITIHTSVLPHDDPDESLAFYRDILGFEVRNDVGQGKMRWITVGPADQPSTSILLAPPAADPGVTEDERRTIAEMMAKGTYGWILLATRDLDGTFDQLRAGGAEVVQEPTEQPYGIRDCAFRDPAGNLVRLQELR